LQQLEGLWEVIGLTAEGAWHKSNVGEGVGKGIGADEGVLHGVNLD